jgi:transglycosylase-like protein with SLT domain
MSIQDNDQIYVDAGNEFGVDPNLLRAQGMIEDASGDPNAIGPDTKYGRAIGPAQLLPSTAASLGVSDPTDPKQAIRGQAKLMAENLKRYGDKQTALLAYHGGTDQSNWGPKTKAYAGNVMDQYQQLAQNTDSNQPIDPIEAALNARANEKPDAVSAPEVDPIEAALTQRALEKNQKAAIKPPISTIEDLAKTAPSSIVKGINAIPQWLGYGVNGIANTMGEAAYGINRAMGAPKDEALYNRLTSINPIFTGNTIADAGLQTGNALMGKPAPANPLTSSVIHDPETAPGRFENALIMGALGAKATGGASAIPKVSLTAGLGGGLGAQTASELFPGSPSAQLAGGLTGGTAGGIAHSAIAPEALPSDVATTFKNAQDQFGVKVPSAVMTGGNNLVERMAGKADTSEMTSQLNKTAADLIGANDSGEGHSTINQQSFMDAKKNNSAAYQKLDSEIGNVPLDNHLGDIADQLKSAAQPRFDKISSDLYSRLNPDGSISSSDIRDLIGHDSNLRKYASSANEDIAEPAQNIISTLKTALKDHATPEQLQQLAETDNKYKLMSDFQKIARESGVGNQVKPQAIRDVINKSYSRVNDYQTPAKDVSNLLNTVAPKSAYQSGINGIKGSGSGLGNILGNAEMGASILMGEPLTGLAVRYTPKIASAVASKYVNSDFYRNKLMQNASHLP